MNFYISDMDFRYVSQTRLSPNNTFIIQSAPISRVPSMEPLIQKKDLNSLQSKNSASYHEMYPQMEDEPLIEPFVKEKEIKKKISTASKLHYDILEEKDEEEQASENEKPNSMNTTNNQMKNESLFEPHVKEAEIKKKISNVNKLQYDILEEKDEEEQDNIKLI